MASISAGEAIDTLDRGHARVRGAIRGLHPSQLERSATIGGGDWSARDLLVHLTSWEAHALEALEAWRLGRVAPIDQALRRQGLAVVNEAALRAARGRSLAVVRRGFDDTHRRLIGELRAMSAEEWASAPTFRKRRGTGDLLGRILGGPDGPFEHASAHLPDLEAYAAAVRGRPVGPSRPRQPAASQRGGSP